MEVKITGSIEEIKELLQVIASNKEQDLLIDNVSIRGRRGKEGPKLSSQNEIESIKGTDD